MTKTEATRIARRARQYGYFAPTSNSVEVSCPLCSERVGGERSQWIEGGSIPRTLDRYMLEHLEDHGYSPLA